MDAAADPRWGLPHSPPDAPGPSGFTPSSATTSTSSSAPAPAWARSWQAARQRPADVYGVEAQDGDQQADNDRPGIHDDPNVTGALAHGRIELIVAHGGITPSTAAMPTSPPAAIGKPGGVSQETKQAVD